MRLLVVLVVALATGGVAGVLHSQWNRTGIREQFRPINPGSVSQFIGALDAEEVDVVDGPIAVVVGSTEYDFGTMERRGIRSHTFVVRNDGTEPLTLIKGETTCKCTLSSLAAGEILPGKSVEVKLEWTAKEVGPSLQFYQSADIISNDPNNRLIQLVVKGNIIQSVMPKPERMTMNGLSSGEGVTVKGKVFSYKQTEEPLEILEVEFLEEAPEGIFEISFKHLFFRHPELGRTSQQVRLGVPAAQERGRGGGQRQEHELGLFASRGREGADLRPVRLAEPLASLSLVAARQLGVLQQHFDLGAGAA